MHLADQSLLLLNSLPFFRHRCDLSGWAAHIGALSLVSAQSARPKKSLESSSTNNPLQLSTAQMKTSTIRRLRKQPILLTKSNLSDRIHSPVIATRRAQTIYKLSTTFHPALRVCTSAKELAGSAKGRRTRQGVSAMWLDPN